jgi:hypothetical protein
LAAVVEKAPDAEQWTATAVEAGTPVALKKERKGAFMVVASGLQLITARRVSKAFSHSVT